MLSIVIPVLNEEAVIGKTLEYFKSKLTIPHEIIVSDGNSTDKTVEIARHFADKVVTYTDAKRQTIAQGRNEGAKVAVGEYLAYIDAECFVPDPDTFFKQTIKCLEENPRVVALTVSIRVAPEVETFADKTVYTLFNLYMRILNGIFGIGIAAGEFQMFRKSSFDQIGGYNGALVASEDVNIYYRLSRIGKIKFIHKLTMYHSGRRAHKIGWPKLLYQWMMNTVWAVFTSKSYTNEWKPIR